MSRNHWEGSSQSPQADPRGRQFAAAALGGPSSGQVALLVAVPGFAIDLPSICCGGLHQFAERCLHSRAPNWVKQQVGLTSSVIASAKGTMYRQTSSSFSMEEAWTYNIWQLRGRMQGKWWWGIDGHRRFSARLVVEIWYDLMQPCQIARRAETKIQWDQHASPGLRVCWASGSNPSPCLFLASRV